MDEFLSGIRSLFSQPSRPSGATRVSPTSIARRAPELVGRLMRRGSIGSDELASLTQNLTPAQKRAVTENLDAFRSYFRQARRAQVAGSGRAFLRRPLGMTPGQLVNRMGIGATLGGLLKGAVYPRVRGSLPGMDEVIRRELMEQSPSLPVSALIEAAQEFNQEQEDLENLIRGPRSSSARERAAAEELLQSMEEDMQGMGDDRRALRAATTLRAGTRARPSAPEMGDAVEGMYPNEALMQNAITALRKIEQDLTPEQAERQRVREEDFARRVRATERAFDPFPGSPRLDFPERDAIAVLMAGDEDDVSESPSVEDVASVLEAMVQDIPKVSSPMLRQPSFIPSGRPRMGAEQIPATTMRILGGRYRDIPAGATQAEVEAMLSGRELEAYRNLVDINRRSLGGETLRERAEREFYEGMSPDGIKVPSVTPQHRSSAMRADRASKRRRLQTTSPGTFGELLDESITDFQGAPMMSEREILRMLRGE